MNAAWFVLRKEWVDAWRDRRTLLAVILTSVLTGPLLLLVLSALVADLEKRAEAREVFVAGIEHAPSLRNYLERQTVVLQEAPADYARLLKDKRLGDPVIVVPADFEAKLRSGEGPQVALITSSANSRAQSSRGRVLRLLQGFESEQAALRLAARGIGPALVQVVRLDERDLASPATRGAQITGMLPFFILMAVLYGAMNAALDTTAGERERGSLEPLLANPAPRWALVLGKWGAVASVGMAIAVLACLSFLPGQWMLRSESLAALFQFGWREAGLFIALLVPLAAALAGLMMAISIRCRTFKEAQASNTVVILAVSLLPLVSVFNQSGERPWHLWVPALAQSVLMGRVLNGEAIGVADVLLPLAICGVLAAACIAFVARRLAAAALR